MVILAGFFFLLSGAVLYCNRGHFSSSIVLYTFFFLLSVGVGWRRSAGTRAWPPLLRPLLAMGLLLFLLALVHHHRLLYAVPGTPLALMQGGLKLALGLGLGLAALFMPAQNVAPRVFRWLAVGLWVVLSTCQLLVPWVSPHPHIDVFVNLTLGVDYLWQGMNPYAQPYPDIYHGLYRYASGMGYFPAVLFWLAPFRLTLGDIRFGYSASSLVFAWFLRWQLQKAGVEERWTWVCPLLWLALPVNLFVIEQAWVDYLLIAQLVLVWVLLEHRKAALSAVVLGGICATKQYGFLITGFGLLAIGRLVGLRSALRAAGIACLTFLACVLPFAWADWPSFKYITIDNLVTSGLRKDAYSMQVYLHQKLQWEMPQSLVTALALAGALLGGAAIWRSLPKQALGAMAYACWTAYGFALIFGKQAFCNYYHLGDFSKRISFIMLRRPAESKYPSWATQGGAPDGFPPPASLACSV